MKKLVWIVGAVVMMMAAHVAFSQTQEGVITYEVRRNNHRNLPPGQEGQKAMLPEFTSFKEQLFFNASESLFKPLVEDEEDEDNGGGPRRFRFRVRTQIYTNHGSEKITMYMPMMGKNYLIADSVKVSPWKFGTEVKVILGYDCKQAFYTDTTNRQKQVVTAWYTDKIRPFVGPEKYNTLPGGVLAIDINNGDRVLVALKIDARPVKPAEVKEPSDGQKITKAEFDKVMAEQRKQFQGGRGGFRTN